MRPNQRRLTIIDALALIAATALGLVGSVSIFNGPFYSANSFLAFDIRFLARWSALRSYLQHFSFVASPCLATWTLALSVLAFNQPRKPLKKIARQPGIAACWAASISLSISILLEVISWMRRQVGWDDFMDWGFQSAFRTAGCTVLTVWIIGAMSGGLRPEPNWLDRLGRLIGIIWVIAMPLPAWSAW